MRGGTTGQDRLGRRKSKNGPHLLKFSDRVAESLGLFGNSATVHLHLHQLLHKTVTLRVHKITQAPARNSGGRGVGVRGRGVGVRGGGREGCTVEYPHPDLWLSISPFNLVTELFSFSFSLSDSRSSSLKPCRMNSNIL